MVARAALLGTTALVGVSLATAAMAQTSPTGGSVIDNSATGGGYQLTNSTALTVNNVTINNTTGAPSVHGVNWTSSTFSASGRGFALTGANSITSTAGSAINFASTGGENMGLSLLGDQTLTGLSGLVLSNNGAIFHSGAGSLSLVAQAAGQGVGLDFTSSNSCICDTSFTGPISATNFATGVRLNALAGINFSTGAGGLIAGVTGIRADSDGDVALSIGGDISVSNSGIQATSDGAISIDAVGDIVSSAGHAITATSALASGNTIDVSGAVTGLFGINLMAGGFITTIAEGATVTGTGLNSRAIITQANSTVINDGSLLTTAGAAGFSVGVQFATSGTVINTGLINADTTSGYGAYANQALTLTNSGTISGGGYGVYAGTGSIITNLDGGVIAGGSQAIYLVGAATVDLQAGSTTGAITAASAGLETVTVAGDLTGAYTGGSGIDAFTLGATGTMTSAGLGAGNDSFTFEGGVISGLVDGGLGTDSFISNLGTGSASLSLNAVTGFETYAHQAGDLTLTGSRTGGAGWTLVPGTSLTLDGSLSVTGTAIQMNGNGDAATVSILAGSTLSGYVGVNYNTGFPNNFDNAGAITATTMGVFSNGPLAATNTGTITATTGSAFSFGFSASTVTNSGTLTGGSDADTGFGVWSYNGATVNNTGTITGGAGGVSSGRIVGGTTFGGLLTVTNGATGDITGVVGITTGGSSSLTLNNSGLVQGAAGSGVAANGTGAVSITNNAGGEITGATNGVSLLGGSIQNSGTITTVGGGIGDVGYGIYGSSFDGVTTVTNNAGGNITGRWVGIRLLGSGAITNNGRIQGDRFAAAEIQTTTQITNNDGGVIYGASAEGYGLLINGGESTITNNAGGLIVGQGGGGIYARGVATATVTNAGLIGVGSVDGAGAYTFGGAGYAIDLANGGTIANSGTIRGGGSGVMSQGGLVNLTNNAAGLIEGGLTYSGGLFQDAVIARGGTILNAGTITTASRPGTLAQPTYSAIYWGASGGVITNAASGSVKGGSDAVFGTAIQARGVTTFNNYGSATGGAVAGSGFRQFNDAASTLNLYAGSVTGSILTGAADDVLSVYSGRGTSGAATVDGASGITLQAAGTLAGAAFGAIDLGGGTNTLHLRGTGDGTAANGAIGDLDLSDVAGASVLSKLDAGIWTLTGDGAGVSAINAGDGGGDDGALIFDGTSGLTGDIFVNGAVIRAGTAGAFGTGAIHMINPTISYGATGTYANDISLEVASPASTNPTTLETDAGIIATLSGAITTGAGLGVDAVQPLVIGGAGAVVLTNSANSWAGDTTINAGATLQGAADTISGDAIVNGGDLVFNQAADGTTALDISGTGDLTLIGGAVLTLSGANTWTGATQINLGTLNAAGGSAIGDGSAVTISGGGALGLADDETIGSLAGAGQALLGANTLSVGADGTSTVFSGVISGVGALTKVGGGILTLTGVNTHTGLTSVTDGVLELVNSAAIADTGTVQISADGLLAVASFETIANLSGDGVVIVGSGAALALGAASGQYDGDVGGAGHFRIAGGALALGGDLTNAGGLQIFNGSIASITSAGSVTAPETAVNLYGGSDLTNAGAITGGSDAYEWGVDAHAATSSVVNTADGSITGWRGVQFNTDATTGVLVNDGSITALTQAISAFSTTGALTLTNSGMAAGGDHGLMAVGTAHVTNTAPGVMSGGVFNAVYSGGDAATVANAGLMEGGNAGVYLDGDDTVIENSGVIQVAGSTAPTVVSGVYVSGAGASVINSGVIESTVSGGRGIYLSGGAGSIANQSGGVISGLDDSAIILAGADYTLDLQAGSTVNGDIDATSADGVDLVLAGTLNGGFFGGAGADALTLVGGAGVSGPLNAGDGVDVLTLTGGDGALNTATLAGIESRALTGTGTWTLTGADALEADWTVETGVLAISGGAAVHDGAEIALAAAGSLQLLSDEAIGALSGAGSVLLGDNLLAVGANGDDTTFGGVISGAGDFAKIGGGVLTLAGANTWTGQTLVDAGTLRLGASNVLADATAIHLAAGAALDLAGADETIGGLSGLGDITFGGGGLTFGGADLAFGGTLSGAGSLTHTSGLFTLLGDHTVGSIRNAGGELSFLGSTTGSVSATGGAITGQGVIDGALTISGGAILSPGLAGVSNGIGGFVTGGLTLNGGTLAIDVLGESGGNLVDQILVNGTANLAGGLLDANFIGPVTDFNFTTTYIVVAADQLVGQFDNGGEFTADPATEGLYWRVRYDLVEDAAVIELRQVIDFQIGANGDKNQNAVGAALNLGQIDAGDDWAAVLEALAPLDDETLAAALSSIGGDSLANSTTSTLNATDLFLGAIRQGSGRGDRAEGGDALDFGSRLMLSREGFSGRLAGQDNINLGVLEDASDAPHRGVWLNAYASKSDLEGRAGEADLATDITGLAGGFGVQAGDLTIGIAMGVSDLKGDVEARTSGYEVSLTHAAIYARYDDAVWFGDAALTSYSGEMESTRAILVGAGAAQAAGATNLNGHGATLGLGRRFQLGDATQLAVGAVGAAAMVDLDAFVETGAGALSLEVARQRREWQTLTVDARLAHHYALGDGNLRAYVGLGAMATSGDRQALADMRFSGAAPGFGGFSVEGAETPPLAGIVDVGAEFEADGNWTASIGYRGVYSDRLDDHRLGARIGLRW